MSKHYSPAIKECSQVHAGPLPSSLSDNSSLSPGASDRHHLWVIDKMLDHDVKNKLALVKWSGYAEPQWIPCADIHPDVFKILLKRLETRLGSSVCIWGSLSLGPPAPFISLLVLFALLIILLLFID